MVNETDKNIRKLQLIYDRVFAIREFLSEQLDHVGVDEFQVRLETVETLFLESKPIINKVIDNVEEAELQEVHQAFKDFEKQYYFVKSKLGECIKNHKVAAKDIYTTPHNSRSNSIESMVESHQQVDQLDLKLPDIPIPIFTGIITEWLTFKEVFEAVVHNNERISDVVKFTHLLHHLQGEPKETIGHITLSAAGYEKAWNDLHNRYHNKRVILNLHIDKLYNLPYVNKDNPSDLRKLLNNCNSHISSLKVCKQSLDGLAEQMVIYMVVTRLDPFSRRDWENTLKNDELPTWEQMFNFLDKRCRVIESVDLSNSKRNVSNHQQFKQRFTQHKPSSTTKTFISNLTPQQSAFGNKTPSQSTQPNIIQCLMCKGSHQLCLCPKFLELSTQDRYAKVKSLSICHNCFRGNHYTYSCRAPRCKICNQRHHSLLHHIEEPNEVSLNPETAKPNQTQTKTYTIQGSNSVKKVLLSTAIVLIQDKTNKFHECRALLDSASQSNLITESLSKKLGLECTNTTMTISGVNSMAASVQSKCTTVIKSKHIKYSESLEFLILPVISSFIPESTVNISTWSLPNSVHLADPEFYIPREIDLLLGAEIFFKILCSGQIRLRDNLPILQNSVFGYIINGTLLEPIVPLSQKFMLHNINHSGQTTNDQLNQSIQKFWEVESVPTKQFMSKEEQQCETVFVKTHSRDPQSGRYTVDLPFRNAVHALGESYNQALKRFNYLESKLSKNVQLREMYTKFINEFLELGHMRLADDTSLHSTQRFYMPHHAILKPNSTTTKLRVVFDGSAKSSSGLSLNDVLMVGPTVQSNLLSIILRFRLYPYVITSDITKMYRQVLVNPNHQSYQRILWQPDQTTNIQTYELCTVTYGTACAPYLATRVLNQLADDEYVNFPIASKILKSDTYVDDIITGGNSIDEVLTIQNELIELLRKGGFSLHKWCSNVDPLLTRIPNEDRENIFKTDTSSNESIKTLGLAWKPHSDTFIFDMQPLVNQTIISKRTIVSDTSRLYDPLGLLAPVVITAKLFIQHLWKSHIDWDTPIPLNLQEKYINFRNTLMDINYMSFDRYVLSPNSTHVELHGYADASELAYGACIYIRSRNTTNKFKISLLCSKTKVAPLKALTIPRLELCACLLLARLIKIVTESIQIKFQSIILWSDSSIALSWIKTPTHKLEVFQANRVNEIQLLTAHCTWKHISSENNPADILSRGMIPSELKVTELWWQGPYFLKSDESSWPTEKFVVKEDESVTLGVKPFKVLLATIETDDSNKFALIEKYSSFTKLIRVTAYCKRFITHCRNKTIRKNRHSRLLDCEDTEAALRTLIEIVQLDSFPKEFLKLKSNSDISNSSNVKSLNLFLDPNNLIRVGGRLQNSELDYDSKHQYLLPSKPYFTKLLVQHEHQKNYHAGPQLLVSLVRQRFWPIRTKALANQIVRNCVTCSKSKPKITSQIMGDLPRERIAVSRPFTTTGVDFCGPFYTRNKYQRNSTHHKTYVAIFVCFVTKAVHIELVTDQTSEAFIACFKRFTSRRGKPVSVWSDNSTTFVGTRNELRKLYELFINEEHFESINQFCLNERISWKFIPPRSPNFGGLWESAVKSLKTHLKRITSSTVLTFEELNTLVINIEGILNSRPLWPMSDDPNDPEPLTAGHFLIGRPITALNEPSIVEIPSNHLSKWKRVTQMTQSFWRRYSLEYLHHLQQRVKWKSVNTNVKIGDIVLVVDENLSVSNWLMGRVIEIIPGKDGKIRVVNVKTKNGIFKRAISKICILPVQTDP